MLVGLIGCCEEITMVLCVIYRVNDALVMMCFEVVITECEIFEV